MGWKLGWELKRGAQSGNHEESDQEWKGAQTLWRNLDMARTDHEGDEQAERDPYTEVRRHEKSMLDAARECRASEMVNGALLGGTKETLRRRETGSPRLRIFRFERPPVVTAESSGPGEAKDRNGHAQRFESEQPERREE